MYAVEVRDHIMIAHSFRGEMFGPAQALHGATFVVDVAFFSPELTAEGVVVDIGRAHEVLKEILVLLPTRIWMPFRNSPVATPRRKCSAATSSMPWPKPCRWAGSALLRPRGCASCFTKAMWRGRGSRPISRHDPGGSLAFPGALDTPTGGYAYDREVLAHLASHGVEAQPLALPSGFPFPDAAALEEALQRLRRVPAECLLLVDGLALGALPAEGLAAVADRLVALIHHPLALEEGLSGPARTRLAASERAALAMCRAVITTSAATARSLVSEYGVPASRITVAEPGVAHADRSPCTGEIPRILAVGSAIPRKSYPLLVTVLADLAHLPWTATLIGSLDLDPAEAARIRRAIAAHGLDDRIILRGAVSRRSWMRPMGPATCSFTPRSMKDTAWCWRKLCGAACR